MADIIFNLDAREKALYDKIGKVEARADRLQGKLGKVGGSGARSFGKIGQSMQGLLRMLGGPLGIGGAIAGLVMSVRSAYREMLEEHRKFLGNIEKTASAKARFLWNALDLPGGKDAAEKLADDVAAEAGVELDKVYDILATGISAGGSGDTLKQAAVFAARGEQKGLGSGQELVGAALDLAKITGMDDAESNFAFLRQVGAASRITELHGQMRMIAPLQAGAVAGDDPEEIAELTAATTLMMGGADPHGRKSSTGMVNLISRLRQLELAPTETVDPATGKRETGWGKLEGDTTMQRLGSMQQIWGGADEATRDEILTKIGGEAMMRPIIEAMFANNQQFQNVLQTAQEKIEAPGSASALALVEQFFTDTGTGPDRVADATRQGRAAVDRDATLDREREASTASARELVQTYLKQQGVSSILEVRAEQVMSNMLLQRGRQQPAYYRRMLEGATPEDKKETQSYQALVAALDEMQQAYTVRALKDAGFEDLAGHIDRLGTAAEKLAAAAEARPKQQEID